MNVGIIGGGMTGLTLALLLSDKNIHVSIIEKENTLGGLSCPQEITAGLCWDRFYHAILSSDDEVLELLETIGLAKDIQFKETKTGFYSEKELHSMSNSMEFLFFKPLNIYHKIRLGLGIIYSSRLTGVHNLEQQYAQSWLIKVFGRRNYEILWDPLLRSKFGSARHRTSAALIWATIKRYYATREGTSKKELMGYVPGGYHSIIARLRARISANSGLFFTNTQAARIAQLPNGTIRIHCEDGSQKDFDKVIATTPNPDIMGLFTDWPQEFFNKLNAVQYLGLVCLTLVLKKQLSPYYVLNITDEGFPFTGVIEMSNLVPGSELGDQTLVYLPKYMVSDDPLFTCDNAKIFLSFFKSLQKIFPHLCQNDVIQWRVNREKYVQPLLDINYSQKIYGMRTPIDNFYILNTTMIKDSNLNNNRVIKLAKTMADVILNEPKHSSKSHD